MKMGGKVLNVRQRVSVRYCGGIQGTIVPTGTPVAWGRLGNQVKRRGPCRFGRANNAELKHVFKLGTSNLKPFRSQSARASENWGARGLNVVLHIMLDRGL
jgi:hypothetical protein